MVLTVFYTSVTGSRETKKQQERLFSVLDSKGIAYQKKDIAAESELKDKMRFLANDPKALPPQISNGEQYCGDFNAFEEAVECGTLEQFLKI
ncbi:SH3 domain-binding glutamic acid-rich-like protein 3 [Gouania willdenowi]|uniref:SH3 domain-binding glutamic acid-rich-like protein 3 n=1 Tax=Gouania willdenowi TaxID=441366 RepID=A0A8C5EMR7_GOUWI|nr:SH3 domain-binding glutamic acid-rich-like protein 3 [Gouania willdenowi]